MQYNNKIFGTLQNKNIFSHFLSEFLNSQVIFHDHDTLMIRLRILERNYNIKVDLMLSFA